ncbi:MAG TPA: YqgE/AlgH family protein [Saprospiraceae bacterium]|nr:YqgE/AlgH family protein [Saprospiraceae bacterium]
MTNTDKDLKRGKVLLAEPFMLDRDFKRSAVVLCEHNKEGSLGFILNRPLAISVDGLVKDFPEFEAEVYSGGPVDHRTLHYLHNLGDMLDDSVKIARGVYWGGDFEKLKVLISTELVKPKNIRFFLGYSGWSAGQLEEEMRLGSWMLADLFANYVFKTEPDDLWQQVMHNKGDKYTVLAQIPELNGWN